MRSMLPLVLTLVGTSLAASADAQISDRVIQDEGVALLLKFRQFSARGELRSTGTRTPTETRIDVVITHPDTWTPAQVSTLPEKLAGGDERLRELLHNSGIDWLTFPRLAITTYHPGPPGIPPPLEYVQALQAQYGADRVIAIIDEYPYGGSAMLCGPYAVVKDVGLPGFANVYAHEIFHTLCLDHNPESAVIPPEGFEHNRAVWFCPPGGGDGFGTFMTQYGVPCGWYDTNTLTGPGVFYNGVELVEDYARQTEVLEVVAPLAALERDVPGPCVSDGATMCLDSSHGAGDRRFRIRVAFSTVLNGGLEGMGRPTVLSDSTESGLFSFFQSSNKEMLLKVVNGCGLNGHFWVFFGTTTNVGFEVTVEDTAAGNNWSYVSPDLSAGQVQDITALPCD